jgi:septum site-determining protein MinC
LVRTESENTFQATLDLGLAGVMDSVGVEQASAQIAETNEPEQGQFVYRGNLRSGQVLRRSEDVVVLGDVNPGAEIVSDGNILIWGRLRGIAHAGAGGDRDKIVGALLMEPVQVRIADLVGVSANEGGRLFGRRNKRRGATPAAEIASVDSNRIVTGSWDTVRSYSLSSRRR